MTNRSEATGSPEEDSAADVYDRITDAVISLDEQWRITFLNERAERLLELDESDLVGAEIWDEFPESGDPAFQRGFEHAMENQDPVTFEEYAEPLDAWLEVRAYPSETGLSVYFRDVTQRIQRETELRDREQALRDAYEVVADPDLTFDEQVERLLHIVRTTIGTDYATLSRVDENTDEYVFEAVDAPADADLEAGETTSLRTTNCERAVSRRRTLVLNDVETDAPDLADRAGNAEWGISCYLGTPVTVDGDVYGTFCFYDMDARSEEFSDWAVTFVELLGNWVGQELERQQRNLELETSNERLEEFAYVASHDLQEPLRMVTNYLRLIEQRYADELDDDGREFIEYAVDGADRMSEMIDALLAYSRIETEGQPLEPVDLDDVLDAVRTDLQLQLDESDATLTAETLPRVRGDSDQLRQVFQNLVSNAITYSGDEPPDIRISAERNGNEYVVSVRDEGIGIDPTHADSIFEVFNRLHSHEEHAGTGIGLALCRKIVERHGGDIWVDAEPGEGSTFSFTLPAADEM